MVSEATPSTNKTTREIYYDILDVLCNKFMGLSPFEVMKADLEDVFNLYVDCIIHSRREKGQNINNEWVTSKNATWH